MRSLNRPPVRCDELRIVHFSDIHFGQSRKNEQRHVHKDVRDKAIEDLAVMRKLHGEAHAVALVGDAAFSGEKLEFDEATQWLDAACAACGCDPGNVYIVPGNHDVDRKKINGVARTLHNAIRATETDQDLNTLLGSVLTDSDSEAPLLGKLLAYREFAGGWGCDFTSAEEAFWSSVVADLGAVDIRIAGLNTVLVSDSLDRPGAMILNTRQYVNGTSAAKCEELIILAHHPLEWLKNKLKVREYIASRARVFIAGHEHNADVRLVDNGVGFERLEINSGAVTPPPGDDFGYNYNWLMFSVEEAPPKHLLRIAVHPRTWISKTTAFGPDSQMFHPNPLPGIFRLPLRDIKAPVQTVDIPKVPEATEIPQPSAEMPAASARAETDTNSSAEEGTMSFQPAPTHSSNERDLRRKFWHGLTRLQRLQVLIELGLIAESAPNLTHGVERDAFEMLIRDNRLSELSKTIADISKT
jgi:hypothetical protein